MLSTAWMVMIPLLGPVASGAEDPDGFGDAFGDEASWTDDELESSLAPYGEWLEVNGTRVWRPVGMGPDWRPYTNGHWAYTNVGWTWVSHWAWGWAPFHYGRWHAHARLGWIWYPGRVWAPAWVAWRYGDGWVAWAPLPPQVTWHAGTFANVNIVASFDPIWWVAVHDHHFLSAHIARSVLPVARTRHLIHRTPVHLPYAYDRAHHRVHHHGVPVQRIERARGAPIRAQRLSVQHHGHPRWTPRRAQAQPGTIQRRPAPRIDPAREQLQHRAPNRVHRAPPAVQRQPRPDMHRRGAAPQRGHGPRR